MAADKDLMGAQRDSANRAQRDSGTQQEGRTGPGRIVREVGSQHARMLAELRRELGDSEEFAAAAVRLAEDFGAVAATAVDAVHERALEGAGIVAAEPQPSADPPPCPEPVAHDEFGELPSLYQPGHMRRRLEQLLETNRRYGHPFGLAVFDASGPDTRDSGGDGETVLSILGVALRDSIRIVDEAFRLEEDAICVLAPNLRTVEGMQMAERLLNQLDELERAGGLRISVAAGVVACPEHGKDADELLHKADAALWRARAVGQPVGVGALQDH